MIDVLIVLVVFLQVMRWAQLGLVRGSFSLAGFIIGLFLGSLMAPYAVELVDTSLAKLIMAFSVIILAAIVLGSLGRLAGAHLSGLTKRLRLGKLDAVLGGALGGLLALVFIWLLASIITGTQFPQLSRTVRASAILKLMDQHLPPAPAIMGRVTSFINSHGFPQVFVGFEPSPVEPVQTPSSAEVRRALQAAGASTVRIESLGCGGLVNGSGFVAADGLVVTNAHVLAGIDNPAIVDRSGYHSGTTIYFDEDLDIAILRAEGLAGPPLAIEDQTVERGTSAAVLGYPGGGRLEAAPAGVLRQMLARGRDIYGQSISIRSIYELQTHVEEGNSGGPVVTPDGTVIGVVFARSQTESGKGYAITSNVVLPIVNQVRQSTQEVSTNQCVPR